MKSIFSPHLHLSKLLWSDHLVQGSCVLDATCGNGHDTLFLAKTVLSPNEGYVLSLDIQKIALDNTKILLAKSLPEELLSRIELRQECHAKFQTEKRFDLITYNLGYLPGTDKSLTTQTSTTLESLDHTMKFLNPHGAISIVCYPGHPEGEKELKSLLMKVKSFDPHIWNVSHHTWTNRPLSPSVIWITLRSKTIG